MKKVVMCMVCREVYVNSVRITDISNLANLLPEFMYAPSSVSFEEHICPNCRTFTSEETCREILKRRGGKK
jgi:hypothetical protein